MRESQLFGTLIVIFKKVWRRQKMQGVLPSMQRVKYISIYTYEPRHVISNNVSF